MSPGSESAACVVGVNQVKRAIQQGGVVTVFVAEDVEARILEPVLRACVSMNITPVYVSSRHELGRRCGIDVGASAVASYEEEADSKAD